MVIESLSNVPFTVVGLWGAPGCRADKVFHRWLCRLWSPLFEVSAGSLQEKAQVSRGLGRSFLGCQSRLLFYSFRFELG